jgi:hypothetical protein
VEVEQIDGNEYSIGREDEMKRWRWKKSCAGGRRAWIMSALKGAIMLKLRVLVRVSSFLRECMMGVMPCHSSSCAAHNHQGGD